MHAHRYKSFVFCAATVLCAVCALWNGGFHPGDMGDWLWDAPKLWDCITQNPSTCTSISRFPLSYTLNSAFLHIFHNLFQTDYAIVQTWVNAAWMSFPLLLLPYRSNRWWLPLLYLLPLYSTSLPRFYIFCGSIEIQAGVLTGYVLWRLHHTQNNHFLTLCCSNILWFFACQYKETNSALWFLSWCSLSILWFFKKRFSPFTAFKQYAPHALYGCMASVLAQCGYNYLKYKSILPVEYLTSNPAGYLNPTIMLHNAFWLVFSPNGGLLIF